MISTMLKGNRFVLQSLQWAARRPQLAESREPHKATRQLRSHNSVETPGKHQFKVSVRAG